jgi:uncharacterized protein (DUF2384 family)
VKESKPYKQLEKELPTVNDSTQMYYYISNNNINNGYLGMLQKLIGLNDDILSKWLNITTRTLHNYKKAKEVTLKDNTKEHIVSLLSLYKHGAEVFNTKENFEKWLMASNYYLDNKAPKDFLDTISGIRLIDNKLSAIEFGENV